MSGVRFLSTVVAIFITFLWAGYVVNAYQKNAALQQLAQTQTDATSKNKIAEINKGDDRAISDDDQGQVSSKDEISANAKVSSSKGEVEVAKVDAGIDPDVAKADEMARAASEEFTKHIREADAKVLKVPAEKIEEKQKVAAVKDVPTKKDVIASKAPKEKIAKVEAHKKEVTKEETVVQAEKSVSDVKSDDKPTVVHKASVRFETIAQKKGGLLTKEVADTFVPDADGKGEEKDQSRISSDKVLARISDDPDRDLETPLALAKERDVIAEATRDALTDVVDERVKDKVDRIETHFESRLSIITASDDNKSSTEHDVARGGKDNSRLSKDRVVVAVNKHQPKAEVVVQDKKAVSTKNDEKKELTKVEGDKKAAKVEVAKAPETKVTEAEVAKKEEPLRKPIWTVPTGVTPEYSVVEKIERGLDSVAEVASEAGTQISEKVADLGENVKEVITAPKKWEIPTGVTPGGDEDKTPSQKEIKVAEVASDKNKVTSTKTEVAVVPIPKKKEAEVAVKSTPEETGENKVYVSSQLDDYNGAKLYDENGELIVTKAPTKKAPETPKGLVKRIINIFADEKKTADVKKKKAEGETLLSRVDKVRFEAIKNLMVEEVDYKFTNAKKGEGEIVVKGRSQAAAKLSLYIGVRYLGDVIADSTGNWTFSKELFVPQGSHILQAQQMSDSGIAVARKTLPFIQKKKGKAPEGYDKDGIGIELGDKALASLKKKLKKEKDAAGGAKKLSKKEQRELKRNKALAARTPLPVRKTGKERLVGSAQLKKGKEIQVAALDKKLDTTKTVAKKSGDKKASDDNSAEKGKIKEVSKEKLVKEETKETDKKSAPKYYIVKAGDTLGRIAKNELGNHNAYKTILKLNKKLKSANLIYPGQKLLISAGGGELIAETIEKAPKTKVAALGAKSLPKKKEATATKQDNDSKGPITSHYVVKSGDSLWKIAAKVYGNGSKYKQLIKLNPKVLKNPGSIKPNTKLRVKAG
jgi:nucleoid-associated protein YgaU